MRMKATVADTSRAGHGSKLGGALPWCKFPTCTCLSCKLETCTTEERHQEPSNFEPCPPRLRHVRSWSARSAAGQGGTSARVGCSDVRGHTTRFGRTA